MNELISYFKKVNSISLEVKKKSTFNISINIATTNDVDSVNRTPVSEHRD